MRVIETALEGVLQIEPNVFADERGWFMESWNERDFSEAVGRPISFVQDNHSRSTKGVLRGIHYQIPPSAQGKLVRVIAGAVLDVAVDLRRSSPNFGAWVGAELSAENRRQLWIPAGFGHGFITQSEWAEVLYKATDYYDPQAERAVRWDDPRLGIDWGAAVPVLNGRDAAAPLMADADAFP